MTQEQAFIPQLISQKSSNICHEIVYFSYGVGILTLLAQIVIPLSWTPVPITGQTMGVTFLSLLWGRRRAPLVVLSYIGLSALGLPLLAGQVTLALGPTNGYLVGMIIASYWMGFLADQGCTKKFWTCWISAVSGSAIVLGSGALGLMLYLPADKVLWAGVLPFLPGDFIKTLLAVLSARGFSFLVKARDPFSGKS